jgi:phosphate starvation-inducible PhoH-like protein
MAAKKSSTETTVKKINVPENIRDYIFFKRLPFKLDEEQWKFIEAVWNKNNIGVFCNACAGSSKTTLATAMALLMTAEFKMYESIHYIVSPCQESTLGFLPGNVDDKISYYIDPLIDAILTCGYDPNKLIVKEDNMENVKNGTAIINAIPSTFLRGRNFQNSFVIIDEIQNATTHEIKKILSRCHDNCKILCLGHTGQIDLKFPQDSGFSRYLDSARKQNFIEIVELTKDYRGKFSQWADSI